MIRNILFGVMVLLLCFPLIQDLTHILKPMRLHGAITEPVYKKLTWQGWWDGSYQDTMTTYAKEKTGVRPDLTRLANQLDYSLFRRMHASGVVIGLKGYLYEQNYIDEYCGSNALPYSEWSERLWKLKKVQDTLSRLGIYTVAIHAGSKASYYPEYFPEDMRCESGLANDHFLFNRVADSLGVHVIDFNTWLISLKADPGGDLFTKQGIHWSKYAATLAADSFVKYLRSQAGINLPDLKWVKGDPETKPRESDIDIFQGLNLMMKPDRDTFYYPHIWYEGEGREKPKMIFVADSYMWTWMDLKIPMNISSEWEFWYYFNSIWIDGGREDKIANYNWPAQLVKSRCIVIMFSECNLRSYGAGFINAAYDYFYVPKK